MNLEIRDKWVKALRSSKYKKGKGVLRSRDCFCVLGVLCDVVDPNGWVPDDNEDFYFYTYEKDRQYGSIPISLRRGLKLTRSNEVTLWRMNDNGVLSFDDFANWIEKHVKVDA